LNILRNYFKLGSTHLAIFGLKRGEEDRSGAIKKEKRRKKDGITAVRALNGNWEWRRMAPVCGSFRFILIEWGGGGEDEWPIRWAMVGVDEHSPEWNWEME
jgi:hypothetical protein